MRSGSASKLDAEAQQSFDFLSEQLHGLRRAFSTLSDVFVEEVDSLRAEQIDPIQCSSALQPYDGPRTRDADRHDGRRESGSPPSRAGRTGQG